MRGGGKKKKGGWEELMYSQKRAEPEMRACQLFEPIAPDVLVPQRESIMFNAYGKIGATISSVEMPAKHLGKQGSPQLQLFLN